VPALNVELVPALLPEPQPSSKMRAKHAPAAPVKERLIQHPSLERRKQHHIGKPMVATKLARELLANVSPDFSEKLLGETGPPRRYVPIFDLAAKCGGSLVRVEPPT
jgi:hypothetical protein